MRRQLASLVASLFLALAAACASDPGAPAADGSGDGGAQDAESSGGPGACAPPSRAAQTHAGSLAGDETWGADSPHAVTADLTVPAGVKLTIEPCAEVRLREGVYFTVQGTLTARGEENRRITFRRDDPSARFAALFVRAPGEIDLGYVDLEGGGAMANLTYGATVIVEGEALPPARPLRVDHVTVADSAGYGIFLRRWAGFAEGSTDLTVTGAGAEAADYPFPVRISLNAVGTLPPGRYTGNARDEIQLVGESPHYDVEIDDVLRDRGVPYQVGGGGAFGLIGVRGSAGLATLTVEPGVTVKFFSTDANIGAFTVGATGDVPTGQLVAVGTAAAPITFTGAGEAPAAGAWEGVIFSGPLAAGNRLEHVRIEAAGAHNGDSGYGCPPGGGATDGALKIFSEPGGSFLKSSTIARSSSHGVFRAWTGAEVDFLQTNTFSDVAGCNQVLPQPPTGRCPDDPPCPK